MLTIEMKIREEDLDPALRAMNELFCKVSRKLWVDHFIKKLPLKDLKRSYLAKYKISSTHFNSIKYELAGAHKARLAVLATQIQDRKGAIAGTEKTIAKLIKDSKTLTSHLISIATYKEKVKLWKATPSSKKPKTPAKIRQLHTPVLQSELKKKAFQVHQKKRRLSILKVRLQQLQNEFLQPSLCFGSKTLFRKQFHLRENEYKSHGDWLTDWRMARSNHSFWIGSHEERGRNRNARFDSLTKTLRLNVPEALQEKFGKHIVISNVHFPYGEDLFLAAHEFEEFEYNIRKKKDVRIGKPISYRILERDKGFYLQAIFEEAVPTRTTSRWKGAIGLDLNADHIAMVEIDATGNLVSNRSYCFDLRNKTSQQSEAILGDHIASICDHAVQTGKSICHETLDFRVKKSALREHGGPAYARMLSSFAYSKFQDLLQSRAKKLGVELCPQNPAYSSVIGHYKYHSYKRLSSHEKAAFVLARRGLRLSERPKSSDARLRTVSICDGDVTAFEKKMRSRHIWSYWSRNCQDIREHLRRDPKVPLKPWVDPRRLSAVKAAWSYRCAVPDGDRGDSELRMLEEILTRHQREESLLLPRGESCSLPAYFNL